MQDAKSNFRFCVMCGQKYTPMLLREDPQSLEKEQRWRNGELIQNVWPEASEIQREQLLTGICSDECWNKLFAEEDE